MKRVVIRIDQEVYDAVKSAASQANQPESAFIRGVLEARSAKLLASLGADIMTSLLRSEMRNALLGMENRIIKILAKATGASASGMYLSMQCIAQANKRDASETHQRARVKAAEYLRQGKED